MTNLTSTHLSVGTNTWSRKLWTNQGFATKPVGQLLVVEKPTLLVKQFNLTVTRLEKETRTKMKIAKFVVEKLRCDTTQRKNKKIPNLK